MRAVIRTICSVLLISVLFGSNVYAASITDSVVKIFVTSNKIDYYRPWQSKGIERSSGSGSIIDGNKILTNAHVVSDHTFIQVKKNSGPRKYTARLLAIGHDCDLALLTVDDPSFFKNVKPLTLGGLPKLQDTVTVIGYPQGGGKISITEGVVSRVEVTGYSQSSRKLLAVQIDAAINPGNSGGPVVQNRKLVGVAMQRFKTGQNIGYMIPIPVIEHFFEDNKDKQYDGFPMLGINFTNTENATLRSFYKITKREGGIVIGRVMPFSSVKDHLQENDIILSIDGIDIGEDGTFQFRDNERLLLTHLISQKQVGDRVKLKIIRKGKTKMVSFRLKAYKSLVPHPKYYQKPPYYIYGGFIFTVLSRDLLESWGDRWWETAPLDFVYYLMGSGSLNKEAREDIVVLLGVLSDDMNVGYHGSGNEIVTELNGEKIVSFKQFVSRLNEIKTHKKYMIIKTNYSHRIILDNHNIDTINASILKRNNIPSQFSSDVKQWLAKD